MKKIISFVLTLFLAIGAFAMSGCALLDLIGGKSDLTKAMEAMDNFTFISTSLPTNDKDYICYKFTKDKLELTANVGKKWWDATDPTDYVLLENSYFTNYQTTVQHKSKTEYE